MKLGKTILHFCVLTIILLHSALPHAHKTEGSHFQNYTVHQKTNSILDFLVLAFQEDENHFLDTFIPSETIFEIEKNAFSNQNFDAILGRFPAKFEVKISADAFPETPENTLKSISKRFYQLRAPPVSLFFS